MIYCEVAGVSFSAGNFSFVYEITKSEEIFNLFFDAEKNVKCDYLDCARKLRMAFEAIALHEETVDRLSQEANVGKTSDKIREEILNEIKRPASTINYKSMLIDRCKPRCREFESFLVQYSYLKYATNDDDIKMKISQYIRYIYAFGSESSHINNGVDPKYSPTKENCFRAIKSFHDFLCIYYHYDSKYDHTLTPVGNYIAVPTIVTDKLGLSLDVGKRLYIRERKSDFGFYILSNDSESISDAQRRDIDTIAKLWDENYEDPANVIRLVDCLSSPNSDYRYHVYALPGPPFKLSIEFVSNLSLKDKHDIAKGICRGIQTIHSYSPPMYHRNISPDAFYVFEINGKYKPLLARFDCIKDTAENQFTVLKNVEKRIANTTLNSFFAPELLNNSIKDGTDWEKADAFSLAKTIVFILTSKIVDKETMAETIEIIDTSDEVKIVLMDMLGDKVCQRPAVAQLLDVL